MRSAVVVGTLDGDQGDGTTAAAAVPLIMYVLFLVP